MSLKRDFENDELLIELVKKKQELYDLSSSKYSDNITKRKAWKEISEQLNYTVIKCKTRWEQLRAQHRKHLNKIKTKTGQASTYNLKWKYEDQMTFLKVFMKVDRVDSPSSVGQDENESQHEHKYQFETYSGNEGVDEEKEQEERDGYMRFSDESESRESGDGIFAKSRKFVQPVRKSQPAPTIQPAPKETTIESLMKLILEEKMKQKKQAEKHEVDNFFSLMATTVKKFDVVDQHYVRTKIFNLISDVEAKYLSQSHSNENVQYPPASSHQYSGTTPLSPKFVATEYSISETNQHNSENYLLQLKEEK